MTNFHPNQGNQHAKKLTTPELRRQAYEQYCAHIASGKSKKSWVFKHPEISLYWETMEKYIRENPREFDPEHMKIAACQGLARWEQVVEDSAEGKNKDANTASLQMLMRNKFKWDRRDQEFDDQDPTELQMTHDKILHQISEIQASYLIE
jgi:hypothetical protein